MAGLTGGKSTWTLTSRATALREGSFHPGLEPGGTTHQTCPRCMSVKLGPKYSGTLAGQPQCHHPSIWPNVVARWGQALHKIWYKPHQTRVFRWGHEVVREGPVQSLRPQPRSAGPQGRRGGARHWALSWPVHLGSIGQAWKGKGRQCSCTPGARPLSLGGWCHLPFGRSLTAEDWNQRR